MAFLHKSIYNAQTGGKAQTGRKPFYYVTGLKNRSMLFRQRRPISSVKCIKPAQWNDYMAAFNVQMG